MSDPIEFKTPTEYDFDSGGFIDVDYPGGELSKDPSRDLMMGIYFVNRKDRDEFGLTIIGETPPELDALLVKPDYEEPSGAGLTVDQIRRKYSSDYISYWEQSKLKKIVYVEDSYTLALLASTYASLINAPLIVEGSSLDDLQDCYTGDPCVFDNKEIILVGTQQWLDSVTCPPKASCTDKLTLTELQERYISLTDTDKIILTNPDDPDISVWEYFEQDKSMAKSFVLYSKTSLGSPILASAKHELIISTTSTNYQDVDAFIDNKISTLSLTPEYLTIIASPVAIQMYYPSPISGYALSLDAGRYSMIDDNPPPLDLAVGRIFSITTSDVSSKIARSIFYEKTLKNEDKILVTRGNPWIGAAAEVYVWGKVLSVTGYQTLAKPAGTRAESVEDYLRPEDYKNKFLIIYIDHGAAHWAGISSVSIPYLDNSFMIPEACSTCDFRGANPKGLLFCANLLRKGGIGYIGETDIGAGINFEGYLTEMFAHGSTLGKAFINMKNANPSSSYYEGFGDDDFDGGPILLGDPTLKLKTIHTMPKPQLNFISEVGDERNYKLIVPAMRIEIPADVANLDSKYGGPVSGPVSAYFATTAYGTLLGSYVTTFYSKFDYSFDDFEPKAITAGWSLFKGKAAGNKEMIWIKSPEKDPRPEDSYFSTANDYEFTNFEFDITFYEEAPDFIIENINLNGRELNFDVSNIGNGEGVVASEFQVILKGCYDETCIIPVGQDTYDHWKSGLVLEIDLEPDQKKSFSTMFPAEDEEGDSFHDYSIFKVWIRPNYPETFIQQNYNNDKVEGAIIQNE